MYILYAVCGLLTILGAILLTGRGANLLSGYNTMSEAERARYDAPKICRVTGVFLLVFAFLLFGLAMEWLPIYAFLAAAFLAVPALLLYTNTRCYRDPASVGTPQGQEADSVLGTAPSMNGTIPEAERQKRRRDLLVIIGVAGLLLVLFAFVTLMLLKGSQPPAYAIVDGTLEITSQYGTRIPLADIRKIERLDVMPALLAKKNGFDMDAVRKGLFRTADGDATLFVNLDKPPFLRLTTTSGVFILNDETPEKTDALYHALIAGQP